ncbi:hypothetical protein N7532_002514 [Penicillium argentinense]|uniref:Uncharacterized protein n=1 Tax=Penicillium argentinense TaxID=1131581 RepID=A0A9W9G0H4_9EURO|nr:uncharacterized protein N7532_002514 [Penicillium argentinense]KAJ5109869.1 hypothetical protein N7532_002514 [Penicillium argentinense]
MDPFLKLPWFALKAILIELPDLPTLHRLYQASPTIADFLNNFDGMFSEVVEGILTNQPTCYSPSMQFSFRCCVYLWWRAEGPHNDNPLPEAFGLFMEDLTFHLPRFITEQILVGNLRIIPEINETFRESCGRRPLPRSAPATYLVRLLELSSYVRMRTHKCFHNMLIRCMSVTPQECLERIGPLWPGFSPPMPIDIGPPSWIEEQRIMVATVAYQIFFELKEAVARGTFTVGPSEFHKRCLNENRVRDFWAKPIDPPPGSMLRFLMLHARDSIIAVVDWAHTFFELEEPGTSVSSSWASYCCPETRVAPRLQYMGLQSLNWNPGSIGTVLCSSHHDLYREVGFPFWSNQRLLAMGFEVILNRPHNVPLLGVPLWQNWAAMALGIDDDGF